MGALAQSSNDDESLGGKYQSLITKQVTFPAPPPLWQNMRRQPKSSSPKNNKLERYVLAWLAFDDDMLCTDATRREREKE